MRYIHIFWTINEKDEDKAMEMLDEAFRLIDDGRIATWVLDTEEWETLKEVVLKTATEFIFNKD